MFEAITSAFPTITSWLRDHTLKIVIIIAGVFIAHKVIDYLVEKGIRRAIISDLRTSPEAEKKREDTLIQIATSTLHVLLWIVGVMMILSELGVDIGPLLAAAGVAGLAFGFGGQYLIRDVIAGLFIILENQYRVNDVVCLDKTCGLVENITLRMTRIRDLDGTVHHVPHGEVSIVSNMSKTFARVNLDIGVAYSSDMKKVIEVVNKVGNDLAEDPDFKEMIIKPPQFLRVNKFGDSAIEIKILGDTQPLKQWDVAGEMRKRLKVAFDREGIEIPFPQRVMHQAKK